MKKDHLVFLHHMLDCIKSIESDVKNITKEQFLKKRTATNSVLWNMEVLGEAAKNIPTDFRKEHPEIPWQTISGMRDKLIHEYFGIDLGNVWKVVKEDVPNLKKQIMEILEKEEIKK